MEQDGYETEYLRFIAPATARVRFAKALDRTVTGSINELVQAAKYYLDDGERSPFDVAVELNELLLSAIAPSKADKYGRPREVFQEFVKSVEV